MKPLSESDLWPLPVYEQVRDEFRSKVIAEKQHRRVHVGPYMTFVFENRLTVKFQVMEILRVEKISDAAHVREELDGFNTMLPPPDGLSATLLIELQGSEPEVKAELTRLVGLARHVHLEFDGTRVSGEFDSGRDDGAKVSAVQYVRFPLGNLAGKLTGAGAIELVVDHPHYTHRTALTPQARASLARDLDPA